MTGMREDLIAAVCHEANREIQRQQNDPTIGVGRPWTHLDDEMRESVIDGVRGVIRGNSPAQSHENWVAFKVAHGWTWGPIKDEVTKTHPLLRPYNQLPESQKTKDRLFVAIVNALAY